MPRGSQEEQHVSLVPLGVSLPWCRFDFHAFFTDEKVKMMTNSQVGMYLKLLAHQWQEGSIPNDGYGLMAIVGISDESSAEYEKMVWVVKACFQRNGTRKRWINPHMEAIRAQQLEQHHNRRKAGRLGGLATARLVASPQQSRKDRP